MIASFDEISKGRMSRASLSGDKSTQCSRQVEAQETQALQYLPIVQSNIGFRISSHNTTTPYLAPALIRIDSTKRYQPSKSHSHNADLQLARLSVSCADK